MLTWAEQIAKQVIQRRPDKDEYVCAACVSPSGPVLAGDLRTAAVSHFVVQALTGLGRRAKLVLCREDLPRGDGPSPFHALGMEPDFRCQDRGAADFLAAGRNAPYETGGDAPLLQSCEVPGVRGNAGTLAGESGLTLEGLLEIYQPEVLLWLCAKNEPGRAFDFCLDDGFLRAYGEFDRMLSRYLDGSADDTMKSIVAASLTGGRRVDPVPMSLLAQMGCVVGFDIPRLEAVLEKNGTPYTHEQFRDRLDRARRWLDSCAPEQVCTLRTWRNWEAYSTLTDEQKGEIAALHTHLRDNEYTLDELNAMIYAVPQEARGVELDAREKKKAQGPFFRNVYRLLLDREQGPRLYLFLDALDKGDYLPLLDFSHPRTQEEAELDAKARAPVPAEEEPEPEAVCGDPDPVDDFKPPISLDHFNTMDLRVCKILKCEEIRKARSNYKLTLFDGKGERVIVSSLKGLYTPRQLEGRKIIVVANLEPVRLTGVTSQGMLVAATNNACGCKVIFVDDSVPEGTPIR